MHELLKPNHTQIPNVILDKLMYRLPDAELRVLLYICRRTYGFQREKDQISYTQFIDGIVTRDGVRLDGGCGLSRPGVNKALTNLINWEVIIREEKSTGNVYSLNLMVDFSKVVKYLNQLSSLTKSGKATLPKPVKLLNLQKKEKERKESILTDGAVKEVFNLKKEIQKLEDSTRRDLNIIAFYADAIYDRLKPNITNAEQMQLFIKENLRVAGTLAKAKYTDDQLLTGLAAVKGKYGKKIDWKLTTIKKELVQ